MKQMALGLILVLAGCATTPEPSHVVRQATPAVATDPSGAGPQWPADAPSIHARSAILIDARTGHTLYQKNADVLTPVASTQKLLTALLVVGAGDLSDPVTIQRSDTRVEPTKLGLHTGEVYPRYRLLEAMMVKSENDAAAALARDVAGSESAFVAAMNRKAMEIGARSSRFANPHGLPASQYSTARDMVRIAFAAYREPILRRYMCEPSVTFIFNSGRIKTLEATNKLLTKCSWVNGMKTGYTNASGRCLIASANIGGREFIFAQFGSRTIYIFDDAEKMLQWASMSSSPGFGNAPTFARNP